MLGDEGADLRQLIVNSAPQLSIVILNYNTVAYLRYCLTSIHVNPPARDFEILVVDNASSDGSAEMVARDFPEVRLIQSETNLGFAGGNNVGFREARGNYVFILNPDTIVLPRCLDLLMSYLDAHPDVGAVGPWIREREPDVLDFAPDGLLAVDAHAEAAVRRYDVKPTVEVREKWVNRFGRLRIPISIGRVLARPHTDAGRVVKVDWVLNCASLIRREQVQREFLMDENWFIGTEEIEFCCGWLRSRGFRFVILPMAQIVHFGGRSYTGRADWAAQLYPLMHAAIYVRRVEIFGRFWARADSAVALLDHVALYAGLRILEAIRSKPSRREMIDVYGLLIGVHLRLLTRGIAEAHRINVEFRQWIPAASESR